MFIGVVDGALKKLVQQADTDSWQESSADRFCPAMNDKPSSKLPPRDQGKAQNSADGSGNKMNPAFDSWLETKLHNMFDAVASEPLPPDLLKLLDELEKKTNPSDDDKKSGK